jgi:hypothetical protein
MQDLLRDVALVKQQQAQTQMDALLKAILADSVPM